MSFVSEDPNIAITPERLREIEKWGYVNQPHYGPAVQTALREFQSCYSYWRALGRKDAMDSIKRRMQVEKLWNVLVKARVAETGVAYYLTPQEHAVKTNGNTGGLADQEPGERDQLDSAI
jgi:hypothetical protein